MVENTFILVWKCDKVQIFDVGLDIIGLYSRWYINVTGFWKKKPWFFQWSIIHFTDNMVPSEELFHSLQFMSIWVKIMGMMFAYVTKALGRKLLTPLGEVVQIGCFDAGAPESTYVKGRFQMDLFESFVGTVLPILSCICFLCGFLGHFMAKYPRAYLVYDEHIHGPWMCIPVEPNEKEGQGPQLQQIQEVRAQGRRGGGLPPSVAAGLSSILQR
ncbi:hypothetical protein LINPERHAP1_LOCUS1456 [Linum perenne]